MKPIYTSLFFIVFKAFVILAYVLVPEPYCQVQNFDQEIKLISAPSNFHANFGSAVAVSGDFAIVGEPGADNGFNKVRAVVIFQKKATGSWEQVQKIYDPSQLVGPTGFGGAVAIQGDIALVRASYNSVSNQKGAVHVYKRQGNGEWEIIQTLAAPSDASVGASFGGDISISGAYVAIGASQNNVGASTRVGSVFIYSKDDNGDLSFVQQIVHNDPSVEDFFGKSVSISGDWLMVGADGDNSVVDGETYGSAGAAYAFKRTADDTWVQQQKLVIANRVGGQFGFSVSLDGNAAVIGAPYERQVGTEVTNYGGGAHFYEKNSSEQWVEVESVFSPTSSTSYDNLIFGRFGNGVSLSGNFAVVSAQTDFPLTSESPRPLPYLGTIYVYERTSEGWTYLKKINASDGQPGDSFASSESSRNLVIHDQQIIAGANSAGPSSPGAAYLFHNNIPVSAGMEQSVVCGNSANLNANYPSSGQTGVWTIRAGEGGSLTDASSPSSLFSGVAGRSYVLRWTVLEGVYSAYDETRITLSGTAAYAGPDQTAGTTCGRITLVGNTPASPNGYGYWSVTSASQSGQYSYFYDNTDPATNFFGADRVTYVLRWTVSDGNPGGCTAYDEVTVKYVEETGHADAGSDLIGTATCGQTSVTLGASEPYAGTGQWSIVSGTGGVLADENNPASAFSGITGNSYILKWTVSKAPCPANEDEVEIFFNVPVSVAGNEDSGDGYTGYQEAVIINDECRIIAKVNGGLQFDISPQISATVTVDTRVKTFQEQPYVQRHFDIHPLNLMAPEIYEATITLYVSQDEFTAFNSASTVKLPVNASDADDFKSNLRIWQWHGTPTTVPSSPGNYTGTMADKIDPADSEIIWNASLSVWEIEFAVTGFSGFFITAEGAEPLPVTLVSFSAKKQENTVALNWQTTEETNSEYFEIQHSLDGKHWSKIGQVNASGESRTLQRYTYTHADPASGENLYRMKMVDQNGTFAMSKIVSVKMNGIADLTVFPNPATNAVSATSRETISGYQLLAADGKILRQNAQVHTRQLNVKDLSIPAGLYLLKLTLEKGTIENRKFVIK